MYFFKMISLHLFLRYNIHEVNITMKFEEANLYIQLFIMNVFSMSGVRRERMVKTRSTEELLMRRPEILEV